MTKQEETLKLLEEIKDDLKRLPTLASCYIGLHIILTIFFGVLILIGTNQ